jgi:hypothetical protein
MPQAPQKGNGISRFCGGWQPEKESNHFDSILFKPFVEKVL